MKGGRIAVLCPSRGNPAGLKRLAESVERTSTMADVIAYVENREREIYLRSVPNTNIVWHFGPDGNPAQKVNYLVGVEPDYAAFGMLPDDTHILTPGWDRWLTVTLGSFPNRLGVVSVHHNGGEPVNFPFVSREWIDLVGWLACPDTQNYVWDTVLEMLGEGTLIAYAGPDEFAVHHDKPVNNRHLDNFVGDCVQFFGWCIGKRRTMVKKIREAMAR